MIRFIGLLVLAILITSCSDNRNSSSTAVVIEPVKPLAVLAIEQQGDNDGLTSVALDATESRYDANFTSYRFEVRQSEPVKKRLLAGPGATSNNYAHVMLPEGTYKIKLTVMDSKSEIASVSETITVGGSKPKDWRPTEVNWSFSPYFTPGDETETFYRATGGLPLSLAHAIYETVTETVLDSSALGSTRSSQPPAQQPAAVSGGCGGMLNNAGNGIFTVNGVMGVGIAIAAPGFTAEQVAEKRFAGKISAGTSGASAAGASTKIAGGNKSGACVQAQIDAINDQLRYQEDQIVDLYDRINRDENAFFTALTDEAVAILNIERSTYNELLDEFSGGLVLFMQQAALWDGNYPWRSTGIYPDGEVLNLDLLKIAASNYSNPACTVNKPGADCEGDPEDSGPVSKIDSLDDRFSYDKLAQVAGLKPLDGDGVGDCYYDCWQHVGPADVKAGNPLLNLYTSYSEELLAEVAVCTSPVPGVREGCRYAPDNNVVPLFGQYNTAIGMQYLKSANALQKAYSILQLTNLYNYNRYVATQCANNPDLPSGLTASCLEIQQEYNAKPNLQMKQIGPKLSVNGTFYKSNGNICGTSNIAETPEQNAEALKCAQQQLTMLYAQAFSVLYTNFINFIITDGPVGSQAYPATNVVIPAGMANIEALNDALRNFNFRLDGDTDGLPVLGARFDYEYEIGRGLPDGKRTPIDLLANVAGIQTSSQGATWTADGALYQAYHISDAAACLQTLLEYNANGGSDVKLEDIYPNYEDCPSIFALHDGTSVANGFYNGITVQPYSFKVSPGGASACPAACNSCQSGFDINVPDPDSIDNWTPGGQGLFMTHTGAKECRGFCSGTATTDVPGNTCGDYDFATPGYTDCTQCSDSANTSDTGSWEGQCNDPVMSGTLGNPKDLPTLQVTGCDPNRQYYVKTSTTCESGRWGNNNGSLFCEPALEVDDPAVAVFALSAPMGGNVRQCAVAKIAEVARAGIEGDPLSCAGSDVYYGKRYSNSLSENGAVAPGDGAPATFKQLIDSGEYSLRPSLLLPALDWNSVTGDNGSWLGGCQRATFSGQAGNPTSPPTLEASCKQPDGTYIVSKATCESGHWGNNQGQLVCEFLTSDLTCSNDALGGDPSPGYYKQCFCPEGNQLGWLRPESTTDPDALAPGLTYLSCGNFAEFNPPRVAWEYEDSGGAQYESSDDAPPTYFFFNLSTSGSTFEEDIGTKATTGTGVNYEVAYANVNTDCNAQDNIQLDVVDISNDFTCTSPKSYREGLPAATWIQPVGTQFDNCLQFSSTDARIVNRANDVSVHYNMIIKPKNRLGTGNGPGIPIDLVMQCSDDGIFECSDQSMCMHMVSFRDPEETAEKRAEAMAKRGYICTAITSQRADTRFGKYDTASNENQAVMSCELSDGRKMRLGLNGYSDTGFQDSSNLDDRARITISISD